MPLTGNVRFPDSSIISPPRSASVITTAVVAAVRCPKNRPYYAGGTHRASTIPCATTDRCRALIDCKRASSCHDARRHPEQRTTAAPRSIGRPGGPHADVAPGAQPSPRHRRDVQELHEEGGEYTDRRFERQLRRQSQPRTPRGQRPHSLATAWWEGQGEGPRHQRGPRPRIVTDAAFSRCLCQAFGSPETGPGGNSRTLAAEALYAPLPHGPCFCRRSPPNADETASSPCRSANFSCSSAINSSIPAVSSALDG